MNCFLYYPFSKREYLLHPLKFIKNTWSNLKAGWQRATKGYANRDTWNLNSYLLELIPEMVDYLRKNTSGYPASDKFPTLESWDKYLLEKIIIPLRNAQIESSEQNEYEYIFEQYPISIENGLLIDPCPPELREKWKKRQTEICNWIEQQRYNGFISLINPNIWNNLWD